MQNNFRYDDSSTVYPGTYVPLPNDHEPLKKAGYHYKNTTGLPVNIVESDDSYTIELAIPGVERENLFLEACGNVLSVSVIQNGWHLDNQRRRRLQEFAFEGRYFRKIVLPGNADPVFLSAKYTSGILQLHVSKSKHPLKRVSTSIAIY